MKKGKTVIAPTCQRRRREREKPSQERRLWLRITWGSKIELKQAVAVQPSKVVSIFLGCCGRVLVWMYVPLCGWVEGGDGVSLSRKKWRGVQEMAASLWTRVRQKGRAHAGVGLCPGRALSHGFGQQNAEPATHTCAPPAPGLGGGRASNGPATDTLLRLRLRPGGTFPRVPAWPPTSLGPGCGWARAFLDTLFGLSDHSKIEAARST